MNLNQLEELGFTEVFSIIFNSNELTKLQTKIYDITKNLIIDHDSDLSIDKKISLPFSKIPTKEIWRDIMSEINSSDEFYNFISSESIKNIFKLIYREPKKFNISTFRARFPEQNRVIYNWHQDEGTWYMSKEEDLLEKYPTTLWFSINGADESESIQLLQGSHKSKLLEHKYVEGQGFFNIKKSDFIDKKYIRTIKTLSSQGILFNSLTLHRSVENKTINMRPRYSADIRYYENFKNEKKSIRIDIYFKLKKFFKNFVK